MFCKQELVKTVRLSKKNDTIVKFAESFEFTVPKFDNGIGWYQLKDVKGDFEITNFIRNYDDNSKGTGEIDNSSKEIKLFNSTCVDYTFFILANTEMKEMCVINYKLFIPSAQLKFVKLGHFIKSEIVLPGYDGLKFTYYVKKINGTTNNDIEIHIENSYAEIEIQGKQGDFKCEQSSSKNFDLLLSFSFDPSILIKTSTPDVADENNEKDATVNAEDQASTSEPPLEQNESIQASAIDESRPESVIQTELSSATKLLHKIGSNQLFADVFFIASDGTKIQSYRNILASSSNILMQIFKESTEIPVQIDADGFDADTIESALNFLYDKPDSINGKEMEVFKFAVKYGIQDLIDACCSFFEASVDPSNVCDFIQIAYSNNFDGLKQKCLKVMVEKKIEIDATKKFALPKNILFHAYCL